MKVYYNAKLKERARQLRNHSTRAEIRLWLHLKCKKVMGCDFHRQKPIGNYIADFYCPKVQLVIEVDGYTHNFEEVIKKDRKKQDYLENLGITVLRFRDEEVIEDIDSVLRRIEKHILEYTNSSPRGEDLHTP
jgi:very-short-patch-repair endonuclease